MSKELRCLRCGSPAGPKGYVKRTIGWVRQYWCKNKDCGYRFTPVSYKRWKSSKLPLDLVRLCLNHSLRDLKEELERQNIHVSISTMLSEIRRKPVPDWRTLLWDADLRRRWRLILGLDTTEVKVSGAPNIYFHAVDIPSRIPLIYEILPNRRSKSIEDLLWQLRSAGYKPKLIVTDLALELLEAIEKVYPNVPVQACLFHLRDWLNEKLPTKRRTVDPETYQRWVMVKKAIMHAALAYTRDRQREMVNKLLEMHHSLDENAREVVRLLIEGWLRHCHPMEELEKLGCGKNHTYNNVCERHIKDVKRFMRKMLDFKDLEMAKKYIYALWYYKIQDKKSEIVLSAEGTSLEEHNADEKIIDTSLLIFMPRDILDLEELSKTTKITINILKEQMEKQDLVVTAEYAFTKEYAEKIVKRILNNRPHSLKEATKVAGLDPYTLVDILGKFGIKIVPKTLCMEEATIIYLDNEPKHPDNQSGHD